MKTASSSLAVSLHMGRGHWEGKTCPDAGRGAGEQSLGVFRVDLLS